MNSLQIAGVIASPVAGASPHFARGKLLINETSKHRQVASIAALGQMAEELRKFSVGERVVITGHLTVKENRLQIFVDGIQPNEAIPKSSPCTHRMQIPQVAGAAR